MGERCLSGTKRIQNIHIRITSILTPRDGAKYCKRLNAEPFPYLRQIFFKFGEDVLPDMSVISIVA